MQKLYDICTIEGCGRPHHARGVCYTHYVRAKRGADMSTPVRHRTAKPDACTEEGCSKPVKANGLCGMHLQRVRRHGSTDHRPRTKPYSKCSVDGCDSNSLAQGLCNAHYGKQRKWQAQGVSLQRYQEMHDEQGGKCAICRMPENVKGTHGAVKSLAIDHCHQSGEVRGLLCNNCNRALGMLQDSQSVLLAAILYLDKHTEVELPDPDDETIGMSIVRLRAMDRQRKWLAPWDDF